MGWMYVFLILFSSSFHGSYIYKVVIDENEPWSVSLRQLLKKLSLARTGNVESLIFMKMNRDIIQM